MDASRPDPEAWALQELGDDLLVLTFEVEPEEWAGRTPCTTNRELSSVHDGRDAAQAAGWIERICPDDPNRMRLTEDGRARSKRWTTFPHLPAERALRTWSATDARYERTGPPHIGARETYAEDLPRPIPAHRVVVPGRWVPNKDGKRLHETGWPRVRVIDREERYTFRDGFWARNHGGS